MSMGRRHRGRQGSMWLGYDEVQRGPGHRFYERLNELLRGAEFDRKAEELCAPYFEEDNTPGRRSIPPGVYFRMHLIGYFEGIESERGIAWRCGDSLSLREFLGLEVTERVPDHSTLSRMRTRLPLGVHKEVFVLMLGIVEAKGLLRGQVAGVDSTFLRADASMKAIVRRDTGESYPEFINRLAAESRMGEVSEEDARRFDRKRKGKRSSNKEWESGTDSDARIAKLKDGRTRLAYKAEHVVDLETGALISVSLHRANRGDTETMEETLAEAEENVKELWEDEGDDPDEASTPEKKEEVRCVVADKGYHKGKLLRELKEKGYRTYIPEPRREGRRRWTDKGGRETAVAVYGNRARVKRKKGKALQRKRGELLERTFAHICETGAARRTRLRGKDNVEKPYVLRAAAANLGLVMRKLIGCGTPRGVAGSLARVTRTILGLIFRDKTRWWAGWEFFTRSAIIPATVQTVRPPRAAAAAYMTP